jgi:hypothetical protein
METKISGILLHNPGSHRISPSSVQVADGVVISVGAQPDALQGCATFYICLSQNRDFGGEQIRFQACRNENLGNYRMSNGTPWNDQVSSIRNAQSSGIQSRLYNYQLQQLAVRPRPERRQLPAEPRQRHLRRRRQR